MRKIFILLYALAFSMLGQAQLVVDNTNTVEWYVQNVLLGEGVTVSNVTFNGAPANQINVQCGQFNSLMSNIGVDSGFVMASGDINVAIGPNNAGGSTLVTVDMLSGDPDLEALIPGFPVNDIAILEFDFVPSDDTLSFEYVFASEEYPEFVNSAFNDVFGFFISGPSITGPFSSPGGFPGGSINIALVPGQDIPVTIDNVNDGLNSEFYVDNTFGGDGTEVQFDGFTVPLTAMSPVDCGELHHIKLAIADAGDFAFDSAVFLEAGSFESTPEDLSLDTFFEPGIVESSGVCDSSFANFNRICAADSAFYIMKFQGDAIFGVDYEVFNVPDTIILVPQQFVHNFGILAFDDGIAEGEEEIEVILCSALALEGPYLPQDTAVLNITDNFSLPINSPDINLICPADEVVLIAEATQGVPVFDYTWFDSSGNEVGTGPTLTIPVPSSSEQYTIDVVDFCGFTGENIVTVTNSIPPDPVVTIIEDDDPFCPGAPYDLEANIQDGTPGFSYTWTTGDMTDTTSITPPQGSLGTFPVSVFVTDFCNRVAETTLELVPPLPPQPILELNEILCQGDVLGLETLIAEETGTPPYNFTYLDGSGLIDPSLFSPTSSIGEIPGLDLGEEQVFQVIVTDFCFQFDNQLYIGTDSDTLDVISCFIPNVFTPNDDSQNDTFQVFELLSREGTLHIYNRWGVELFASSQHEWDGEDYPGGTYFYVVEFDDGSEPQSGSFTMLR